MAQRTFYIAGVLAAVSVWPSLVPASPVEDLLRTAGTTYRDMTSFVAEGSIALSSGQGLAQEAAFKSMGKGAQLTREELSGVASYVSVGNADGRWLYMPGANRYSHATPTERDEKQPFTIDIRKFSRLADPATKAQDLGEDVVELAGLPAEKRSCRKIGLPKDLAGPSMQRSGIQSYTIWIDPQTAHVVRERVEITPAAPAGQAPPTLTMTVSYSKTELNGALDDSLFTFTPPPGATLVTQGGPGSEPPSPLIGQPAKDFSLTDLSGKAVSLGSLRGRVVLLDFWATWCGPCKLELPHIQALHEELQAKGLSVVAISNEAEAQIRRFIEKAGYSFPTAVDPGAAVTRAYEVKAYPTVFVIDREGVIRSHYVGLRTEEVLREALTGAGLGK